MQNYITFNGVRVAQPDEENGYSAVLATTSTDDSDRDMSLVMHNTPIGTVIGYDLKWTWITAAEAAEILQQVVNKSQFTMHYFDIYDAQWKDGLFYASNFNSPAFSLREGEEYWSELSFNVRGIYPL